MPNLYIISGCNGAGKTTAAFNILPHNFKCENFLNADEIAKGISPFIPEKAAIEAGRIMLSRMNVFLDKRTDFAIETTLATKSYSKLIISAKEKGYKIYIFYLWLNSVETAKERVRSRVAAGGHNIPEVDIIRRYNRGIKNLKEILFR